MKTKTENVAQRCLVRSNEAHIRKSIAVLKLCAKNWMFATEVAGTESS
jgi:hypothetical protein